MKIKILTYSFTLLSIAFLTSCGGSSSSVSDGGSVSGTVADGYLENARVCLDLNNNKKCEDTEPQDRTDANGKYTIKHQTGEENNPTVAEVLSNTRDKDTRKFAGTKTYTLVAPKGKRNINPITTMIQEKIDKDNSMDADDAAKIMAQDLGVTDPNTLYDDYVEKSAENSKEHKIMYQMSQMIARAMAELKAKLKDILKDIDDNSKQEMIHSKVMDQSIKMAKSFYDKAKVKMDEEGNNAKVEHTFADNELKKPEHQDKIDKIDEDYIGKNNADLKKEFEHELAVKKIDKDAEVINAKNLFTDVEDKVLGFPDIDVNRVQTGTTSTTTLSFLPVLGLFSDSKYYEVALGSASIDLSGAISEDSLAKQIKNLAHAPANISIKGDGTMLIGDATVVKSAAKKNIADKIFRCKDIFDDIVDDNDIVDDIVDKVCNSDNKLKEVTVTFSGDAVAYKYKYTAGDGKIKERVAFNYSAYKDIYATFKNISITFEDSLNNN